MADKIEWGGTPGPWRREGCFATSSGLAIKAGNGDRWTICIAKRVPAPNKIEALDVLINIWNEVHQLLAAIDRAE